MLALAYHRTDDTAKAIETEEKAVALLPPGDAGSRATMVSLCLKGDVNSAVRR